MGLFAKLSSFITSIDSYGTPVTFFYKQNPTYKTCLGGLVTIFICLGCLGYAMF